MIVTSVVLENFLNYKSKKLELTPGLNVFEGANAVGKTNFLDSIFFASLGRSSRQLKDKELINWDSTMGAKVTIKVRKKHSRHSIEIFIDSGGKKRILIDGSPISRIGELMGVLNVVFFSPDEMRLIKESPNDRRRFFDISLSQQSKEYFYTLLRYNSLLQQRNKILKTEKHNKHICDMLDIVDVSFSECMASIMLQRHKFIQKLEPEAKTVHSKISLGKEDLSLIYETENVSFEGVNGVDSIDNLKILIRTLLKGAFEKDLRLEYTTVGTHRDDINITASGIDLRKFGSQGQKRSAVLSLKLAEIQLMKDITGETPVLLLDDVMSELDTDRQMAIFSLIAGIQTLVTTNQFNLDLEFPIQKYTEFQKKA